MKIVHPVHPQDFRQYSTEQIRDRFLLDGLLFPGAQKLVYSHYDRMIVGGILPLSAPVSLENPSELRADFFLQRRELGIINIGGPGRVLVDGDGHSMEKLDCLYIGKGKRDVVFSSDSEATPAKFMLFSAPAHAEYPTQLMRPEGALRAEVGSLENNNERVINKYVHDDGIQSCQLVLGLTNFKPGSIWNTMPPHTHGRRMEAYFYFDLPETARVVHFMGEPQETRHLFLSNEQAILSPPWSIHSGVATANYSFIWAMAGENKAFTDMDAVEIQELM